MQIGSLPLPTQFRSASETWPNRVKHNDDGPGDTYELPTQHAGVAAHIEVQPRLWGLLGKSVEASDAQGQPLEARREWSGFHKVVVTTDPATGLVTRFDPQERTVSVAAPELSSTEKTGPCSERVRYQQEARQTLDAQGDGQFISGLQGQRETVQYSMVREMPPNQTMTVKHDRTFTETTLGHDGSVSSQQVSASRDGRTSAPVVASLSDGNHVQLGDQTWELYLSVK